MLITIVIPRSRIVPESENFPNTEKEYCNMALHYATCHEKLSTRDGGKHTTMAYKFSQFKLLKTYELKAESWEYGQFHQSYA